jgi:hypothetical protein
MRKRIAIAGAVIGTVAGVTISRTIRLWRSWGIDPLEAERALPGDDLVPMPTAIETRAITIDAPPAAIWPWLAQMGFERGGWYSYDQLDNRGRSVDTILPAFQTPQVGDIIPVAPDAGFEVKLVEPGRALVLFNDTALVERQALAGPPRTAMPAGLAASSSMLRQMPRDFAASWAFALEPLEGGRTRLIERFRVHFGAGSPAFRVVGPMLGFGVFLMMRRQLLGVAERATRTAVVPPLAGPATTVGQPEVRSVSVGKERSVVKRSEAPREVLTTAT